MSGRRTKIDALIAGAYGEGMQDDFSPLISYLDERFTKLETTLEEKADKEDVRLLTNAIDAYAKKADTYFQELAALTNKVNRLEQKIEKLAEKIGMDLE